MIPEKLAPEFRIKSRAPRGLRARKFRGARELLHVDANDSNFLPCDFASFARVKLARLTKRTARKTFAMEGRAAISR